MSRMEDALRDALRREQAPEGFADRVLAAVQTREAEPLPGPSEETVGPPAKDDFWVRLLGAFRGPRLRWAAGFATIALVVGMVQFRNERERVEGEKAKDQVMLALRITGGKLRLAQSKVYRIDAPVER